ncbi:hypothetical protein H4582DRAFT_2086581 [Lactarius indigo]|nr:hypothetical protein H4582DRAFT_2086581 [Lactarius indigo]
MVDGDIDKYVNEFEEAARKASYRLNDPQTINLFTKGLPKKLYEKTYDLDEPETFDEWKRATLRRQRNYIHIRARVDEYKDTKPKKVSNAGWTVPQNLANPWAMDTSAISIPSFPRTTTISSELLATSFSLLTMASDANFPLPRHDYSSPTKLTELPLPLTTSSTGPLNNSGTYNAATLGPIVADGHGQPRRRDDGNAHWDPLAPIVIPPTSSPAAGRSPQDSVMGLPESEEPTVPAIDSQPLWDAVPPITNTNLPAEPETIVVRGRALKGATTPRARSRAVSTASAWTHVTEETVSDTGSLDRAAQRMSGQNDPARFHTINDAIRAGLLPPPHGIDVPAVDIASLHLDADESKELNSLADLLAEELSQVVGHAALGWGGYRITNPLPLCKDPDLPVVPATFHAAANLVLTALDAGAAKQDGELITKILTPHSWMRLTLAVLSAIIRGALRSPAPLKNKTMPINNNPDTFPIHQDLLCPKNEGGAAILMANQIAGLFGTASNHPDSDMPESYFDRVTDLVYNKLPHSKTRPAPPKTPALTEQEEAGLWRQARETLLAEYREEIRIDDIAMQQIKDAVKAEIFANLNQEALSNLDEWREVYCREFVDAMHSAMDTLNPGLGDVARLKGKAKGDPLPPTVSQVVRDAEPAIRAEVQARVSEYKAQIDEDIRKGIMEDPTSAFLNQDYHRQLAEDVLREYKDNLAASLQGEKELIKEQMERGAREERTAIREQAIADCETHKDTVRTSVKYWKTHYRNARELSFLRKEANRLGFALTPIDEAAKARELEAFKKYALGPLVVDGYKLSSSPPLRALTPAPDAPHTPPRLLTSALPHDPNVTPTPIRVK